jgi:hypothetical protein
VNLIKVSPTSGYKLDRRLTDNDVLLIEDVFDQSVLDSLLENGSPAYVVNDHFACTEFENVYSMPKILSGILSMYRKNTWPTLENPPTDHAFYFMINKRRVNRFLLLKLLQWFELGLAENYWMPAADDRFDLSGVISEFDSLKDRDWFTSRFQAFLFEPNLIPRRVNAGAPEFTQFDISESYLVWQRYLNPMMSRSAVCLITESVEFQKASVFTEKTLYSVLSMNFPLWLGGYGQAQEWQRLGFDTFDDVIDHRYQHCDTLLERCYRAMHDNLAILTDVNLARSLRERNLDRLHKNIMLLRSHHVEQQISRILNSWPQDLTTSLKGQMI